MTKQIPADDILLEMRGPDGVQVHSPSRFSPEKHPCKHTNCDDYTPRRERRHQTDWPLCVCGAIAQDHD